MRLTQLIEAFGGEMRGAGADHEILTAQLDSRFVQSGALFAALAGSQGEGHDFVAAARKAGAVAILTRRPLELSEAPVQWIHPNPARALGLACHLLARRPSQAMQVFGVTGTNGKTSTAHLLAHILEAAGKSPGVIGTAGHRLAQGQRVTAQHTTPAAPELVNLIRQHRNGGGDSLVMEMSSHALMQERHAGLEFTAAVFTNLTREHLDYHGDMGAYQAAKGRLFDALLPGAHAIGNLDDHAWPSFAALARERGAEILTTSTRQRADLCASNLRMSHEGTTFLLQGMGISERKICFPLCGRFNVENALAALGCALVAGVSLDHALDSLASCTPAPGRMEVFGAGGDPSQARVVVDFAHTPDALSQALQALRSSQVLPSKGQPSGRLICIFGCGGDRDMGKRPLMGRVASQFADHVIVTSDNPRSEDPATIAEGICQGLDTTACTHEIELDRGRAIRQALAHDVLQNPCNTVLIAGKGHETTQQLASGALAFDDRALVRSILEGVAAC